MIVENIEAWGFEHAVRGMRNPMDSWDKIDSKFECDGIKIGENDMALMQKLYKAGPEHRKYLRQIFVSMDITAPLYWWKEFDTYKVGTVANSCSTMHKLTSYPIDYERFELSDYHPELVIDETPDGASVTVEDYVADYFYFLEKLRKEYLNTGDKRVWKELVRWLPSGWTQKRTVTMSYETVVLIIKQRTGHKLNEWKIFIDELKLQLPYLTQIMGESE